MANLEHKPALMTYEELAKLLSSISALVAEGDSFEGFIEYLIPGKEDQMDLVEVRARFRTGNSMGQGGMTIVGEFA